MSFARAELAAALAMQISRSTTSASLKISIEPKVMRREQGKIKGLETNVAMLSAASAITPSCWKAKQQSSLLHTAGFNIDL